MSSLKIVPKDGVAAYSAKHPVTVKLTQGEFEFQDVTPQDITPQSIERVEINIEEWMIPTLEERCAKGKSLCPEDLVKIDGVVHVWLGDGWCALKYANNLVWKVQEE